jgi:hypothetical protein
MDTIKIRNNKKEAFKMPLFYFISLVPKDGGGLM